MITDKQALDIYEKSSGESVFELDDAEIHEIVDSVRKVLSEANPEGSVRHLTWLGHSEEFVVKLADKIRESHL